MALIQAHDPEYAWVTRHTWQSWRERYKKNATRLDTKIAQIVDQKKPAHGEKGQYGYVRKPEEKPKRVRKKKTSMNGDSESPMAGPSTLHSMDTYSVPMPMPMPTLSGVMGPVPGPNDTFDPVAYQTPPPPVFQHMSMPAPVTGQMDAATARQNAREEEMEDDDEWQIREGNAPTPAWAKRKTDEEEGPNKRARTRYVSAIGTGHVIDIEG